MRGGEIKEGRLVGWGLEWSWALGVRSWIRVQGKD